jgi:hypothetical protein
VEDYNKNDELSEEELERKFDVLWKNWESRRRCEKKHIPNFIKDKNRNK